MNRTLAALVVSSLLAGCAQKNDTPAVATKLSKQRANDLPVVVGGPAKDKPFAETLMPVATFTGPMLTGVAASHDGRVFVNFPHWGDDVEYTVAELKDGKAVPYPDLATNKGTLEDIEGKLVSVQSVVVDAKNRLWALDTGSINFGPVRPGAARVWCFDLATNKVARTIVFDETVALRTTYLNDVRFDLTLGQEGTAFITDSSGTGPNAIIVVDLASGKAMRRLNGLPSVQATPKFVGTNEGEKLLSRPKGNESEAFPNLGADGIALDLPGKQLYWTALSGQRLYSCPLDVLANASKTDKDVSAAVKDLGDRGFASDGLECDANGTLYLTDITNSAVQVRENDGTYKILVQDPRLIWPDTLGIADGYLYVTANQLGRQPSYHRGVDKRVQPYALFKIPVSGKPVVAK